MSSKIKQSHLARLAVVYIRQSTLLQVKYNTASTERQRALRERAIRLGWPESRVVVNELDLGKSGASTYKREGFKQVRELVKSRQVGAVFILGASRLSREVGNFAAFIRLSYYKDTLIIDEDAEYDTHIINDRTTIGFQGMVADLEFSNIVENFRRSREVRAATGALHHRLPAGYVYNKSKKIVFDTRKQVRERVQFFFDTFKRLGSARAVVKYFGEKKLKIPSLIREAGRPNRIAWEPLTHTRAIFMLHAPAYAGTYTHGRFVVKEEMVSDDIFDIKYSRVKVDLGQCKVVIHDHHPAYITWEQFLKNEQKLKENRNRPREHGHGAPRKGRALLQGRLRCAKCHISMYVSYAQRGTLYYYSCLREVKELAAKPCQAFTGPYIDQAVTQALLKAFEPAQLDLALQTLASAEEQCGRLEAEWESRMNAARDNASRTERRYKVAVDRNKNSRLTHQLFGEWERADLELQRLERERDVDLNRVPRRVDSEERRKILELARDIPAVWNAETTDMVARKRILQAAISRVDAERDGSTVTLRVHWVTGASHDLKVTLPAQREALVTDPQVIKLIRELGGDYTAREIADRLNEAGHKSKKGKHFTAGIVMQLRKSHGLTLYSYAEQTESGESKTSPDMYTIREAAEVLKVQRNTVALWRQNGRFECVQVCPKGPWLIKLTASMIKDIKTNATTWWSRTGEAYYREMSHKVVKAYDDGAGTLTAIAEKFGVSRSFVRRCLRRRRETGSPEGKFLHCSKLDDKAMNLIRKLVTANPMIGHRELQQHIKEKRGISVTLKMIRSTIYRLGLQRKRRYTISSGAA